MSNFEETPFLINKAHMCFWGIITMSTTIFFWATRFEGSFPVLPKSLKKLQSQISSDTTKPQVWLQTDVQEMLQFCRGIPELSQTDSINWVYDVILKQAEQNSPP